jgi:phage-related protein
LSKPSLPKRLSWRGTAKADFAAFPRIVQREMGYGLFLSQMGERHSVMAKTLKGFGSASVVELRESDEGGTYRAVYTVRYADTVYVLHAFQKKSKRGIATPQRELDVIAQRLKALEREHGR